MTSRSVAAEPKRDASGGWSFVVDLGPDPATGKRRQVRRRGLKTKKAALDELTRLRSQALEGVYVAKQSTTMREYLSSWLATLPAKGLRENTIRSYERTVEHRAYPHIGAVRLQALTPLHLDTMYAALLESGRADGHGGLSPRSVRYLHAILSHALNDAERKGLVLRGSTGRAGSTARTPRVVPIGPRKISRRGPHRPSFRAVPAARAWRTAALRSCRVAVG
jgi:Arm DNA-binding domain/Phage integrase, N-terminal SAM-like domain